MVKLTIDEKNILAEKGSTILQAAKANGIAIPTLCHHEGLSPLANCRLCVVEVTRNSRTRVVTSCNYQVQEGMQVATQTERIVAMRKTIIKLIMGRSPNVKIVRDLAAAMGIEKTPFTLENEKCILCGLCEHVCSEYIGAHAITFTGHGTGKFVSAPFCVSSADCIGCGACVEVCPARCITKKDVEDAKTYYWAEPETVGPARVIYNWNARVAWKKCPKCGNAFPPPSVLPYLEKGEALPKNFFDVCQNCR